MLIRSIQPDDKRMTALSDDPPKLRRASVAGRLTVSETTLTSPVVS